VSAQSCRSWRTCTLHSLVKVLYCSMSTRMPKIKAIYPNGGVPPNMLNIMRLYTLAWFDFFVTPHFAELSRPNRKTDYTLFHCVNQVVAFLWIKQLSVSINPFYPKTLSKRAWIGIFKPNSHNVETRIFNTTLPISTKFCTAIKTTK